MTEIVGDLEGEIEVMTGSDQCDTRRGTDRDRQVRGDENTCQRGRGCGCVIWRPDKLNAGVSHSTYIYDRTAVHWRTTLKT